MQEQHLHIYRNPDGVLGGVCAGIAERFDFDADLLRMLVVVLSVLTAGAFALVYIAVWLILPEKPKYADALDIDPASFRSEVYEQVVHGTQQGVQAPTPTPAPIPPVPPAAASAYYQARPQVSYDVAYAAAPGTASAQASQASQTSSRTANTRFVATGLGLGILLIVVGLIALASAFGLATIDLSAWIYKAGPILFITVGLFIMGRASKSRILLLCAGLALVLFLAVGMYTSLQDGPVDLGVSLRFSPDSVSEWQQD
ncbi:MAG: PspC domain-containing protein [Eggerthellaceae bacterium]|nr:PspC domain-containing protein [Eggerthellaceae bacterium]